MFRRQDPYSYIQSQTLYLNNADGSKQSIGILMTDYKTVLYNDVQVLTTGSADQPDEQQFILTCTQRILLKNPTNTSVTPIPVGSATQESFENYPALLTSTVSLTDQEGNAPDGVTVELLDYAPQTVNAAVQQNTSAGTSTGASTATSNTTGSTYSQSSTYGVSVTAGDTFAGATSSFEHSTTRSTEKSQMEQSGTSSDKQSSSSESMSIKDWGSYSYVNPLSQFPTWIFGQEVPWNAIDCRFSTGAANPNNTNQAEMYISQYMATNLFDGSFLYPPTELSMYGLNFVMKTVWRIRVGYSASTTVTLNHPISYYSASHALTVSNDVAVPVVYMDNAPATLYVQNPDDANLYVEPAVTLDLNVMGLDPIGVNNQVAIIGFIPTRFIPQVDASGQVPQGFRTLATTNDLMIDDTTGYAAGSSSGFVVSGTCLTASWSDTQDFPYQITLYFKIIDSVSEYSLQLKHWKTGTTGVKLTFVVNGDAGQTLVKYVDAEEGEGGDGNVLIVSLRDLDFSSIDYHDYLQLGLNSVSITMEPIDDAWSDCGYQIRAIAIEKS
ncbi:hypothetical protein IGS68_19925 [Skermanella sp. TT6]|uniref:Uncharacterized protein n=1 Tax=Skermanella cutis TaxID=2775420 RepID=A0ABX7B1U3_9PROT|nr:hypothetical protein [Skermanella sp. TT6]QQP88299.1 hypothetical protein IGS68_19925 [Skermanella sp. TT6]